jgi:hypothetical protein
MALLGIAGGAVGAGKIASVEPPARIAACKVALIDATSFFASCLEIFPARLRGLMPERNRLSLA